jgi:hypothetical protein
MSALNSNGLTIRLVAGTTDTILATDDVVVYTGTAAKAVALPAATVQKGKVYRFSNQNTGAVTITPASGTIDGAATQTVAAGAAGAPIVRGLISDGTNWFTF